MLKVKRRKSIVLKLSKSVGQELLETAADEIRQPDEMLNLLVSWVLLQKRLLSFDTSRLLKVNLSVSDVDLPEPWNHVVSGEWEAGEDGTFRRLIVR